tara:strand:- start:1605 stop:2477 length:873 start_codon:yes stop_codon:yes gene_type:complete
MKGIVLAGGLGTRLFPATRVVSKQLLTIYDKPMIFYPISTLMLAGIKDILIISTPSDIPNFQKLLGTGEDLGLKLYYKSQEKPEGLAQAFIVGKEFIADKDVCLILGDNIFYGNGLTELLLEAKNNTTNNNEATIFGYYVDEPKRYGVVEFDKNHKVLSIIEKPYNPKSNYAVVGLYFYPNNVINKVLQVDKSERGEYEITSLNQLYMDNEKLKVEIMHRGFTWFDAGTHQSMLDASNFIATIENRQGLKVSCLEEIAFKKGYIDVTILKKLIKFYKNNPYSNYLKKLLI